MSLIGVTSIQTIRWNSIINHGINIVDSYILLYDGIPAQESHTALWLVIFAWSKCILIPFRAVLGFIPTTLVTQKVRRQGWSWTGLLFSDLMQSIPARIPLPQVIHGNIQGTTGKHLGNTWRSSHSQGISNRNKHLNRGSCCEHPWSTMSTCQVHLQRWSSSPGVATPRDFSENINHEPRVGFSREGVPPNHPTRKIISSDKPTVFGRSTILRNPQPYWYSSWFGWTSDHWRTQTLSTADHQNCLVSRQITSAHLCGELWCFLGCNRWHAANHLYQFPHDDV